MEANLFKNKEMSLEKFIKDDAVRQAVIQSKVYLINERSLIKLQAEEGITCIYSAHSRGREEDLYLVAIINSKLNTVLTSDETWKNVIEEVLPEYKVGCEDYLLKIIPLEYKLQLLKVLDDKYLEYIKIEKYKKIYDKCKKNTKVKKEIEDQIIQGINECFMPDIKDTDIVDKNSSALIMDYLFNPKKWILERVQAHEITQSDIMAYAEIKAKNELLAEMAEKPSERSILCRRIRSALNASAKTVEVTLNTGETFKCKNMVWNVSQIPKADSFEAINFEDIVKIKSSRKIIFKR